MCVFVCMHVCICISMHVCMYVCMHVYTQKRILEKGRYFCDKWYQKFSKHHCSKRDTDVGKIEIYENIN